ncbi:hypothetical protein KA025_01810 [Candidatus Saccharibacteria bacterium]|nr:hypothetical protein [Candidatus Saccharibacteria bacterium]MBP7834801.1 hypothetical protein [Candidatus Saccharibacteria bacterium]
MEIDSRGYCRAFNSALVAAPFDDKKDGFKLKVFEGILPVNYVTRNVSGGIFRADDTNPGYNQRIYESYVEQGQEKAETIKYLRSFGINIPPTYFTAGTNNFNEFHLYSSTQLLAGPNLRDFQHQSPQEDVLFRQPYIDLVTSLCAYYKDCFNNKQLVAFDTFSLRQYVLEDGTKSIYLVDTDSDLVEPDEKLAKYLPTMLDETIRNLEDKFYKKNSTHLGTASVQIEKLRASLTKKA